VTSGHDSSLHCALVDARHQLEALRAERMQLLWYVTQAEAAGSAMLSIAAIRKALGGEVAPP
jgi:hypothetical protein